MDKSAIYFEENYIFRNNRSITSNNDIALTEFVANAWDAGAHNVSITIPYEEIEFIRVEKEGREIASIIENGRFSLVGTEELNRVLDETC